jgi:chromatin segregation and condensation protein Rec8/ScpA/Scc1 (kleisin family)
MDHLGDNKTLGKQVLETAALETVDWRLLNFFPEFEDLGELNTLLETRQQLVAEIAQAEPSDAKRAKLERSLHAGDELTRKLAAYRRMLENELARVNRVAQHSRLLYEDVPDHVSGNSG